MAILVERIIKVVIWKLWVDWLIKFVINVKLKTKADSKCLYSKIITITKIENTFKQSYKIKKSLKPMS